MIPACDGRTVRRSDGRTVSQAESIIAKTALCIASYADALSKRQGLPLKKKLTLMFKLTTQPTTHALKL